MGSSKQLRRVGLFTTTYDQHAQPMDEKRTQAIKDILLRKHRPNLRIIDFSSRISDTPDNEALRVSFYHYHQETPISGLLGVRVLEDRAVPALYYANDIGRGRDLHSRLSRIFSNLDLKSISLESLIPDLASHLQECVVASWAKKKAVNIRPGKIPDSYAMDVLNDLWSELEAILFAAQNGNPTTREQRRTIEINTIVKRMVAEKLLDEEFAKALKRDRKWLEENISRGALPPKETEELKRVLSPSYPGRKLKEAEITCRLKETLNKIAAAGFISTEMGRKLGQDRQVLVEFVQAGSVDDLFDLLRKFGTAFAKAFESYKLSLGMDLNKMIFGDIILLTLNQLVKKESRNILAEAMPAIGQAMDGYRKTERIPIFYVPAMQPSPEMGESPIFLPCVDIHLTVTCADTILASKHVQSSFVKAVAGWGSHL